MLCFNAVSALHVRRMRRVCSSGYRFPGAPENASTFPPGAIRGRYERHATILFRTSTLPRYIANVSFAVSGMWEEKGRQLRFLIIFLGLQSFYGFPFSSRISEAYRSMID